MAKTPPSRKRPKKVLTEPQVSKRALAQVTEYIEWFDKLPPELQHAATHRDKIVKWRKTT